MAAAQEAEAGLACEAELERYDIELLASELQELEEREREVAEAWKRKLKQQEEEYECKVEECRSRRSEMERDLSNKLYKQAN